MKQIAQMGAITLIITGLSGCTQISKTADTVWGGTKSAANFVSAPVKKLLRGSPEQDYVFTEGDEVEIYASPASQYADGSYEVELYDTPALRPAPVQNYVMSDPHDVAFVRLNGDSNAQDWRNCEVRSKGYLFTSETDFRVNPDFEVCMRNKGYVMESELAQYGTHSGQSLSAPAPTRSYTSGYSYP